jgi:hypothetical protein
LYRHRVTGERRVRRVRVVDGARKVVYEVIETASGVVPPPCKCAGRPAQGR